jgi:hypothetical protein
MAISDGVSLHQSHSGKTCYYDPPPSLITRERWAELVELNHVIYRAWDGTRPLLRQVAGKNPQRWPWGTLGVGEVITNWSRP